MVEFKLFRTHQYARLKWYGEVTIKRELVKWVEKKFCKVRDSPIVPANLPGIIVIFSSGIPNSINLRFALSTEVRFR